MATAECTLQQAGAQIDILMHYEHGVAKAGGNHANMDEVTIRAPVSISELPLVAMKLTAGEVAEFWVPVSYRLEGNTAVTEITGYSNAIDNFEIVVLYDNGQCHRSIQRELRAHGV